MRGNFSRFVIFEVSDGFKIRFWHDEWCGDQTLKAAFSMFSIACCKKDSVADHVRFSNDILQWNITFIISMHDWKVELIDYFVL